MPHAPTADDLTRRDLLRLVDALESRVARLEAAEPVALVPNRAIGDVFQVHPDRAAVVVYTFSLNVAAVLLTLTAIQVDLLSDAANPPSTIRGSCSLGVTANGLSLSFNQTTLQTITYVVPAGHWCSFAQAGAGTAALVAQTEVLL